MIRGGAARSARWGAALALVVLLAAGCSDPLPEPRPPSFGPPLAFGCGTVAFPAAALTAPGGAENADTPAAAALRRYLRSGNLAAEDLPLAGYRVLYEEPDRVVFGTNGEVGPIVAIDARNSGGAWSATGLGVCAPQLVVPDGLNAATWRLPAGAPLPGPAAKSFVALVHETDCVSGRSSQGRVLPPLIQRDPTRVLIVFAVREPPSTGLETCPGNPASEYTVELGEPLGARQLLDAGVFPPADVWSPECCG
ncbi:MAG TPA: hypothetical protein VM427_02935 [Patescibacteria group bacterium]|nr:hypothetical protein [Patescibacteria group bacterium]